MYEDLLALSHNFLKIKDSPYKRYLFKKEKFNHRLSIILGQRGVGKTTTLIQSLLDRVNGDLFDPRILYIQVDHFQMGALSMYELAEQFQLLGGKWIVFDEIHKYRNWSEELKSIYDTFPDLTVIASGSSALEIYKGTHDLTRRAIRYSMQGMSFREYLELSYDMKLPLMTLEEICHHHSKLADDIVNRLNGINKKVIPEFHQYLRTGYYPYFFDLKDEALYKMTLEQNLHTTIESDLAAIYPQLTGITISKLKQLLVFIANSVPFTPNWNKIKEILDIGDIRTLKMYFQHLENARLIKTIVSATQKINKLESPAKIYLDNPNQLFSIASNEPEKGTVREIFFLNMLSLNHEARLPSNGDFLIDAKYLFEIGGRNKSYKQIKKEKNAFIAIDTVERGAGNKIPLWLFGFLY